MNLFQTYETSDKSRREFVHRCKPQKMRYVLDYDLSLYFGFSTMSICKEDIRRLNTIDDYLNLEEIRNTFCSLIINILNSSREVYFIDRDEEELMRYSVNKKYLLEYNKYYASLSKCDNLTSTCRLLSKYEVDDLIWDVSLKLNEIWEDV